MRASGPAPLRLLLGSFAALIAVGTLLLLLPWATPPGRPIGFIDALFTATSAVCVTGLIVRDTGSEFTAFGQAVILVLIQFGGVGIMTFSVLAFSALRRRLSIVDRALVRQTLAAVGDWVEVRPLLATVVKFTLAAEAMGAALLFARWQPEFGTPAAAWYAVFHAVSAFCNAGFGLWRNSLMEWRGDVVVNAVVIALIVLGGLGFLVVYEAVSLRFRRRTLSVHSRLVLSTTAVLVLAGAVIFAVLEKDASLAGLPRTDRVLASLFQSVTCRTAGFNTIDIAALSPATLFFMMILMVIGGSPSSTAGGIKTTTFAVLVLTAVNRLRHRVHVNVFNRTLSPASVANALSLALAAFATIVVGLFLLLLLEAPDVTAERHGVFIGYLFETVSALGTVGLSTGATATLTPASRVLIAVLMFVGRLGPLTVAGALAREDQVTDWQYPEEEVLIG